MKRRPPRQRRTRQKVRRIKPSGAWPARAFRVYPDPDLPHYHVEVRVHRTEAMMHREHTRLEGFQSVEDWSGMCRFWYAVRQRKDGVSRPQGLVARIYLNAASLQERPSEIVSHECGHAAMAWARFRGARIRTMAGEEVMCYALGRLVAQVIRHLYALGVFH